MPKYKKAALTIAFLTLLLTGGLTTGYVKASEEDNDNIANQEEMILDSFENDDYESWKRLIAQKGEISEVVSKEDFEEFVSARELARSGQYEAAIQKAERLELKLRDKLI